MARRSTSKKKPEKRPDVKPVVIPLVPQGVIPTNLQFLNLTSELEPHQAKREFFSTLTARAQEFHKEVSTMAQASGVPLEVGVYFRIVPGGTATTPEGE